MQLIKSIFVMTLLTSLLSACGSDKSTNVVEPEPMTPVTYTYEVTLLNNTHNQPLSPITVLSHDGDYMPWQLGMSASLALEHLAESGDSSMMASDAAVYKSVSDTAPLMPGATYTVMIETNDENNYLSIISMLVNTNDAFTGLKQYDVAGWALGDSATFNLFVYDSGSELNSELAQTLPGPVAGGEGFNSERDDVDFVARHAGVVTMDDGLTQSALDQSHRFESIVAKAVIKRVK